MCALLNVKTACRSRINNSGIYSDSDKLLGHFLNELNELMHYVVTKRKKKLFGKSRIFQMSSRRVRQRKKIPKKNRQSHSDAPDKIVE